METACFLGPHLFSTPPAPPAPPPEATIMNNSCHLHRALSDNCYSQGLTFTRFAHRQPCLPPSAMARRKALLQAQQQDANSSHAPNSTRSRLLARKYYNARYEKVDKSHRSTILYADVINSHIDRLENS